MIWEIILEILFAFLGALLTAIATGVGGCFYNEISLYEYLKHPEEYQCS